jgi:hypothetical protein
VIVEGPPTMASEDTLVIALRRAAGEIAAKRSIRDLH